MTNGHIRPQIDWSDIDTENVTHVSTANDLPTPENGTISLDNRVYKIDGYVTISDTLDISSSPVFVGNHGGADGLIYTGGGTMLTGTNGAFFARDLLFSPPGGTMFDLSGDQLTEMLVESCSFADPAGMGNLASLGTIDGFRVPSFKGCNFENFNSGLTFDGTPDKIFIAQCPFRGVDAAGVTILSFASTLTTDIVDMPDNYVKGVQSDTVVIDVDPGATISEIFQYRGTTHDASVTKNNILTGAAGVGEVGYKVSGSFPLAESQVIGEIASTDEAVTTISSQDTYTVLANATALGNETERMSESADGVLQFDGRKDTKVKVTASVTLQGASNETYAVAVAKNGTVEPTSEARIEGTGNTPAFVGPSAVEDLTTGDTLSLQVKNIDGTSDVTVSIYNLNVLGA